MKKKLLVPLLGLLSSLACIQSTAQNLVSNGDFSTAGAPTGCTLTPASGLCHPDQFLVASNFTDKCDFWPSSFDHTSGTAAGQFLIIDFGALSTRTIWAQNVSVTAGKVYTFTFWANRIYTTATTINVMINGKIAIHPNIAASAGWTKYNVDWNATATGTIPLSLVTVAPDSQSDFGIDDISFSINCDATYNPDFSTITHHEGSDPYYTITATPLIDPNSYTGPFGFDWDVAELDASNNPIASTHVWNPWCWWWDTSNNSFKGYDYTVTYTAANNTGTAFNGSPCINNDAGKFHAGHKYRITRGTEAGSCARRTIFHDVYIGAHDVTSVDGVRVNGSIEVYPNPSNGLFAINVGSNDLKDVYVYDAIGKVVYSKSNTTEQSFHIDATQLPKGLYVVKVVDGNSIQVQRIIKQ